MTTFPRRDIPVSNERPNKSPHGTINENNVPTGTKHAIDALQQFQRFIRRRSGHFVRYIVKGKIYRREWYQYSLTLLNPVIIARALLGQ